MLSRRIRIQVAAFVVVALTAVALVGANHAGLARLAGDGYVVRLQLAEAGGLFVNSEVTYRGVAVGRVETLRLADGADGIEAGLRITGGAPPIPANLVAVVANRSAVGEQFVDLQPRTADGPFLGDGSVIPAESTRLPLPVSTLLGSLGAFSASVPDESLRTVVDELYAATQGAGEDVQVLLDSTASLTEAAAARLPETQRLITDGSTVLATQLESSQAWRTFAESARLFAGELAAADGDLRRLVATAPGAATELSTLLGDTDPELSVLIANLLTTATVFEVRTAGLEQLFVVLPQVVAATSTAITPEGARLSQALTFFDPLPCTEGYGTTRRPSSDVTPRPLDTSAGCELPPGDPRSVRGSRNAPGPGAPPAAVPGAFAATTTAPGAAGPAAAAVPTAPGPLGLPALPRVSTTLEELLWLT